MEPPLQHPPPHSTTICWATTASQGVLGPFPRRWRHCLRQGHRYVQDHQRRHGSPYHPRDRRHACLHHHPNILQIHDVMAAISAIVEFAAGWNIPVPGVNKEECSLVPGLTIGDTIPDLEVETTNGKIKLHQFCADNWTIIFSHPGDFTPVCTTELGKMAQYASEFYQRGVKLLGMSCDDLKSHNEWIKDIEAYTPGAKVNYPIIADPKREIIKQLNMVDPDEKDSNGNLPSRALHIVGPDKKIKLSFLYPATTGRNMDEVLRVVESLQKASKFKVATPANWKPGDPVVISPNVTNEQAKEMFPQGFETADLPSKKEYLRFTKV